MPSFQPCTVGSCKREGVVSPEVHDVQLESHQNSGSEVFACFLSTASRLRPEQAADGGLRVLQSVIFTSRSLDTCIMLGVPYVFLI
jgi:hypothetical protein